MSLKDHIVDIEKHDEICCKPTFVVDDFLGLFLHSSIFPVKHPRSS